jgi:hypothetical protein
MSSPALWAQDTRYRVELLVLMHLGHTETPEEAPWAVDYSTALDLLVPEEEAPPCPDPEAEPGTGLAETSLPTEEATLTAKETLAVEEAPPDPNAVFRIEEMGPEMQEAWRRLRLSGPFRPLQYLSWEQGDQAPFPELRVHGEELAYIDDPYAELRAAVLEAAAQEPAAADAGDPLVACTSEPDDAFPAPTEYYLLDGRAMLERSRFLHLDLDLQLREPLYAEPDEAPPTRTPLPASEPPVGAGDDAFVAPPRPSGFAVHGLAQRRQVRSGRMEYFDGPVIGVLAWITAIELADTEER